jgi:hypothetical protein
MKKSEKRRQESASTLANGEIKSTSHPSRASIRARSGDSAQSIRLAVRRQTPEEGRHFDTALNLFLRETVRQFTEGGGK